MHTCSTTSQPTGRNTSRRSSRTSIGAQLRNGSRRILENPQKRDLRLELAALNLNNLSSREGALSRPFSGCNVTQQMNESLKLREFAGWEGGPCPRPSLNSTRQQINRPNLTNLL